jgi:hypothetical protein
MVCDSLENSGRVVPAHLDHGSHTGRGQVRIPSRNVFSGALRVLSRQGHMAQQWFLIKVPSTPGYNGFVGVYRFVHGLLPILRDMRRDMGRQVKLFAKTSSGVRHRLLYGVPVIWMIVDGRLLSSDEEFETVVCRQATTGEYFSSTQHDFG